MRLFLFIISLLVLQVVRGISSDEKLAIAYNLLKEDPDSAFNYTLKLKDEYQNSSNLKIQVKSNFILGYIKKNKGEFGKAIIYYFEAIRQAEKDSRVFIEDLISLHKNCGVIFDDFKAHELAKNYYNVAMEYAAQSGNIKQYVSINYNLSILFREEKKYYLAIEHLEKAQEKVKIGSPKYFDIKNSLGLTYHELKLYTESIQVNRKLIRELPSSNTKIRSYAHHNLARSLIEIDNLDSALLHINLALSIKRIFGNKTQLFSSLHLKGEILATQKKYNASELSLLEAEKLIPEITQKPEYFKIYKTQSDLYFELKDYEKSRHYQNLYTESLNNYIKVQAEIQNTDRSYNMDLITKRYFDEVAKQERIASILFWSRIISGSLLAILIFVVSYNYYKKVKLRREIEADLVKFKFIE